MGIISKFSILQNAHAKLNIKQKTKLLHIADITNPIIEIFNIINFFKEISSSSTSWLSNACKAA